MAGAYRCPNCGIDFPTGTPGAPRAAHSPADANPGGSRAEAPPPSTPNIAERLEIALVELTAPPPPPPPQPEPEPLRASAEVIDIVPEPADDDEGDERELPRSAELRTVPGAAGREGRAESPLGPPGEAGRRGSDLTVSPQRGSAAPLVAEPEPRAMVTTRRRRRSGGLRGTVVTALVLLGLLGVGAWWVNEQGVAESLTNALVPGVAAPELLTIGADEGWVSVPSTMGTVRVSGDGPFRVRVGSEVYTVQPSSTLRIAGAAEQSVAVRAIRAPTTVRVTPAD